MSVIGIIGSFSEVTGIVTVYWIMSCICYNNASYLGFKWYGIFILI